MSALSAWTAAIAGAVVVAGCSDAPRVGVYVNSSNHSKYIELNYPERPSGVRGFGCSTSERPRLPAPYRGATSTTLTRHLALRNTAGRSHSR